MNFIETIKREKAYSRRRRRRRRRWWRRRGSLFFNLSSGFWLLDDLNVIR
jgi:hypothetical protein